MITSKERNDFGLLCLLNIIIYFIFVFPYIPQYCFVRNAIYCNKDVQFIALFATLLSLGVVIRYLDSISKNIRHLEVNLQEEILKRELSELECEFSDKIKKGENVSLLTDEIEKKKKQIRDIQKKRQNN